MDSAISPPEGMGSAFRLAQIMKQGRQFQDRRVLDLSHQLLEEGPGLRPVLALQRLQFLHGIQGMTSTG